jgi:ribonuclease HI
MSSKFYAVAKGRKVGIFQSWKECEIQIKGFPDAKFKSFQTEQEAKEFVKTPIFSKEKKPLVQTNKRKYSTVMEVNKKRIPSILKEVGKLENEEETITVVYTDGSCLNNGREGAKGGIGVFFSEKDERNLSEKLDSKITPTNQRAELMAAIRALEIIKNEESIEIRTDSKYTILCATEFHHSTLLTSLIGGVKSG